MDLFKVADEIQARPYVAPPASDVGRPKYEWDLRKGGVVRETYTKKEATIVGSPLFNKQGGHFNGIDQWIEIPEVEFGGDRVTIETYALWGDW